MSEKKSVETDNLVEVNFGPWPLDLRRAEKEGIPPVAWVAEPYLVEGELHLIVGDGATGKTFLALDTALGLAAGQQIFVDCAVSRPYRVLYVDEDGSPAQALKRILALAKGRGISFDEALSERIKIFSSQGLSLQEEAGRKRLTAAIASTKPEIVFLDTLRAMHNGNENDSEHMAWILRNVLRRSAQKHRFAMIALHHTSKPSPDPWNRGASRSAAQATRGSGEIRNGVDTLLYIETRRGVSTLVMDKTRNLEDADKPDPFPFQIRPVDDDGLQLVRVDQSNGSRQPKLEAARKDLESALSEDSTEELRNKDLLGRLPKLGVRSYGEKTARTALRKLVDEGVFLRREVGKNTFYRRAGKAS